MNKALYPPNWNQIASQVKESAGWTCQCCGKPCRKPGVKWHSFADWLEVNHPDWYPLTSEEVNDDDTGEWGTIQHPQRFTLTCAHKEPATTGNHSDDNLLALCAPCHNQMDAKERARNRTQRQASETGQISLI